MKRDFRFLETRREERKKKKKKKRSWKRRRKRRWRTMLRKIITRSAHAGIDSPVFCARHLSARSNSAVNFLDAWPPSESTRILLARPIIAPLFASLNTSYAVIISPRGFFLSFFPLLVFFFFFHVSNLPTRYVTSIIRVVLRERKTVASAMISFKAKKKKKKK